MDDLFKVVLYILAVVIYALFKMKKGPAKQKPNFPQAPKQPFPHSTPPRSYADMPPQKKEPTLQETIKNIEKEIKHSKEVVKTEKRIKPVKVYEEKREGALEKEILERRPLSYEGLKNDKFHDHFDKVQSYDEIKRYNLDYDQEHKIEFEYPEEEKTLNPYTNFLKDPENIKTAFVMKEIFDRKHF